MITRTHLILAIAFGMLAPASVVSQDETGLRWTSAVELGLMGQGWPMTDSLTFSRLPAEAQSALGGNLWGLGQHAAGLFVAFVSDSDTISVRWNVTEEYLEMPHMPATGVSGVDVYTKDESGQWVWLQNGRPIGAENVMSLTGYATGSYSYLVYFPLYNGVDKIEIGVTWDSTLRGQPAFSAGKPVVFYGSSITQGCCASRPGMAYPALLGRWLDRETINLGFSGSCRMEPEMADLLGQLDPAVFFIDCLPNMTANDIAERAVVFIEKIRAARPNTPIVLAEDRTYGHAFRIDAKKERNISARDALRAVYHDLVSRGFAGLFLVPGDGQLGNDNEAAVDGSHPTDLGFYRQAQFFLPWVKKALAE